ncbi:hypothetical protein M3215_23075 [Bacillus cytotoxicus]|uniref:Uncharacterized protein n=1 Tax=Bacillus cytotoxicus TaxID=580165 RepID=A0ACC6ADK5_9BACI|nr:hypothetical protein [Bacillus cytotoxicus]
MTKTSLHTLLLRNVRYSISYGKYKYIAFFSFIAFLAIVMSVQMKVTGSNSVEIFYLLLKDKGYFLHISEYDPPLFWEFIQFFVLFLIGDFLFHDFKHNRSYLLLRCRSRLQYVLSYIGWIFVQNIVIYLGVFFVIYVCASCMMGNFSLEASPYFKQVIQSELVISVTPSELVCRILFGYIMAGIVLSSIQLLFMQLLSAPIVFFGTIIVSGMSTLSDNQWLPAIHSMILKQSIFDTEHHLTLQVSIVHSFVLYSVITMCILFIFRKKDML